MVKYLSKSSLFNSTQSELLKAIITNNWDGELFVKLKNYALKNNFDMWKIVEKEPLYDYHGTFVITLIHTCRFHNLPKCDKENTTQEITVQWSVDRGVWSLVVIEPNLETKKTTPKWDDPVRTRKIMEQWKKTENFKYTVDILKRLAKE